MDWTTYESDVRNPPDDYRWRSFWSGWKRAAAGREYSSETAHELTWDNLGHRLGRIFGDTFDVLAREMFGWCSKHYEDKGRIK